MMFSTALSARKSLAVDPTSDAEFALMQNLSFEVYSPRKTCDTPTPGYRIIVFAHSQKTAKRHNCVRHLAAYLVDHHSLHGSDVAIIGTVNSGSLDLVTA
jgi:hypothetical protein